MAPNFFNSRQWHPVLLYPNGLGSGDHDQKLIENAGLYAASDEKIEQLRFEVLQELALKFTTQAVPRPTEADWAHSHLEQEELLKKQLLEEYQTNSQEMFQAAMSSLLSQYQPEARIVARETAIREMEYQASERQSAFMRNVMFPKHYSRTQGQYDAIIANNTVETIGTIYSDGIETGIIQRVVGVGRVAGGTAVLVVSLAATETGVGAVAGIPGMIWATDQITTGGAEIGSGRFQETLGAKGAKVAFGDGVAGNIAAFGYDIAGGYAATRFVGSRSTVWNQINPTQEVWPGTVIPRSFELTTQSGVKVWVHGNATEHLAERVVNMSRRQLTPSLIRIGQQAQLTSLEAAVNAATRSGVPLNRVTRVGGWELIFKVPRNPGDLPALIHALPLE